MFKRLQENQPGLVPRAIRLATPFFRRYALRLVIGFVALLGVDFLQLSIPRFIKKAVDELERGTATEAELLHYAAFILFAAIGIAFCRFLWRYLILGFSRLLERDLRDRLFSHLLTLDRLFFQRRTTGELMALSSNDLAAVQLACGMGLVAFVDAVVMTLAALAFMAYINPVLTVIAILPMPFLAVLTRLLSARLHIRFKKVQEQFAKLTEFARTTLSSIRLFKAYTQEMPQTARFDQMGRNYVRNNLKLAVIQGTLFPVSGLVANASLLLVVFFGGRLTIQGVITAGDFVAFISYLFMLTWPMMALGWVTNLFQRGVTSLNRIQDILDENPVLKNPEIPQKLSRHKGNIATRHLNFTYPGQQEPALHDVTIEIKSGLVGIVGKTGSGKSTLCHLLTRLYPVDDGTVFIAGVDVNRLSLAAVRGAMAYVPQDVALFSDTIAANISMGYSGATQDQIEAVAKAVSIHGEIMSIQEGYQARIGEKGVKLSGGQRQRIALARALLLDRPIIIIDDGLSAVDTETEHAIIRSLAGFLEGKTCIIVSHRVAPLMEADEIMVMDEGRIAAKGTHEYLLKNNGFYATIYKYQTSAGQKRVKNEE